MPYTAEISRANPTCFVFLIDQSGSMSELFGGGGGRRKAEGVADAINQLLHTLVIRCSTGESVYPRYDVGVIGYGATVGAAFSGALAGRSLVPINEVADATVRLDERTRKEEDGTGRLVDRKVQVPVWFDPIAQGGTPMSEALRQAYHLLQEWVARHQTSYPPIVINITDGEADSDPTPHAQAIANLVTADGNVLVFNCHISSHAAAPIVFPDSEAGLLDQYARLLFRMSSVLPGPLCAAARGEGFILGEQARGFAFNAGLVDLIRFLDIGTRPSNLR